ncbi:MAG: CHAT domain-containing protein, partial [Verrucomicrobiales bacterium]
MELFRMLFPGAVRNLYNIARFQEKKRRLKIVFTSMIPWVADMPWELAFDRTAGTFLACADVRFIRNVLSPTPTNRFPSKVGPLRILVVSAQPMGAGVLSIEDERRGIHESFRPLIDAGLVEVEVLAGASPTALHERLRYRMDGDEFDIIHFVGHGAFDIDTKVGTLLFEDERGRPKSVTATDFLNILRGRGIRIVFLNACETGRGEKADYNRGVAMELVRDGIPAVIANQYSVIDRSASLFSLHFYACLASGINIADATREARIALHYDGVEPMDWSVPVLFTTTPDARLCRQLAHPAMVGGEDSGAFQILSRPAAGTRRLAGSTRKVVSVWDAENALIYRENLEATLGELNDAQEAFTFNLERFSAPRSLWKVDRKPGRNDGIAYLSCDSVVERMERIRKSIGSDYLFCVTNLPMRDKETNALYYYVDPKETNAAKVAILSTWALNPPLEGRLLKKAIANHMAIFLLEDLSGV